MPSIKIGTNTVTGVYLGATSAAKVYLGTLEIWSAVTPPPPAPPPSTPPPPEPPPPVIASAPIWGSISPASGSSGTVVTVTGQDFSAGTKAKVNEVVCNPSSLTATSLTFTMPTLPYNGDWAVTLFNDNGSCWGTFTYTTPFTPYSVTSAQNLPVPVGCAGCYVTLTGGGGNGGGGYSTSVGPCGGGGGGGGGRIYRSYISRDKLGPTYTVVAGGQAGDSYFTSGSVSLWAWGGGNGYQAYNAQNGAGGQGGSVSVSGNGAFIQSAMGGAGGEGGLYSNSPGDGHGGGGGGGGGADVVFMYSGGVADIPGGRGGDASRDGEPGANASSYGGGGGGGGARKSTIGLPHTLSNGGQGYAGYALCEWI